MSEESRRTSDERKKRVQRLKKLIILVWICSMVVPIVCCAILSVKVHRMNRKLQEAQQALEQIGEAILPAVPAEAVPDNSEAVTEDTEKDTEADALQESLAALERDENLRKVHLTFDDGPGIYTEEILDILDHYGVKATFFVVGREDEASVEILQEIVKRGHTLGMHSYSHKYKEIYASVESFAEDFEKIQNHLYEITGVKSMLYRFPGGSSNTVSRIDMKEFASYLTSQGVTFFDWNISSGDGADRQLSVEELAENCTGNLEAWNNIVILMHDSGEKGTTVEALPEIIENILALEDTVILPITEATEPVQHIHMEQ